MATLAINAGVPIDMSVLNYRALFKGAEAETTTGRRYTLDLGGGDAVEFRGSGFRYDRQDDLIGGTIKSFTISSGAEDLIQYKSGSISAKLFVRIAESKSKEDDLSLTAKLFSKDDILTGSDGADVLRGFKGNDVLHGAGGADSLEGGKGADIFAFLKSDESTAPNWDTISDFSQSEGDRIDLSQLVDGEISFLGNAGFLTGLRPEVAFNISQGQTIVSVSTEGTGVPELTIILSGEINLRESDFAL